MGNKLCSTPQSSVPDDGPALSEMIAGGHQFAFNLYSKLIQGSDHNVIISPTSLSTLLAMIYLVSTETTASQIKQTLQLTDTEELQLYSGARQLTASLSDVNTFIHNSHRLFVKRDKKLKKKLIKDMQRYFKVSPLMLDFDSGSSLKEVNQLIDSDTKGTFKSFLKGDNGLTSETSGLATGALYFKGKWQKEFAEEETDVATFKTGDGSQAQVDMMYNLLETGHHLSNDLDCQVIEVPYVQRDLSFYVFLPNKEDGLNNLEEKITVTMVENLTRKAYENKVQMLLKIPKFSLRNHFSLRQDLVSLGMADVFDETKADLSKITGSRGLYLSDVRHEVAVEVEEEGKPFLAPAFGQMGSCSPGEFVKVHQITVDHPFLFFIQDNTTSAIHVMGRVVNPKADP